jgi:O-antigen ligase
LIQVKNEVLSYSSNAAPETSSGLRLNLWHSSLQSISQHPLAGSGVGSWSTEYNRLQREKNPAHQDVSGNWNPHQEYLLWGVQLGVPGILMFLALMLSVLRDTLKMDDPYARATQSTLLGLAVACLFNAAIYDALIGDFFCVLLGLLLALGLQNPRDMVATPLPYERTT